MWTPGHATADEISNGVTHPEWARLNHGADVLAGDAAASWGPSVQVTTAAKRRVAVARGIQASLAMAQALKMLLPPRVDRVAGYTDAELRAANDFVAALASKQGTRDVLFDIIQKPYLALDREYWEARNTSQRLESVCLDLDKIASQVTDNMTLVGSFPLSVPQEYAQ